MSAQPASNDVSKDKLVADLKIVVAEQPAVAAAAQEAA